ncbi:MAG TPA: pentapeptide repeat-containing protein [Nitrososphaera sp.]|nr:pentapeptide repeat-containing protein [Nitrososphaera sp.]
MPYTYSIRHRFSDKVLHVVQTGDRKVELCAPDLSGLDLSNLILNDANLCAANLEGANLRGAKLAGADLQRANMRGCDIRYSDLSGADLREADLTGAEVYPANVNKKTNLSGVRTDPDFELATLSQAIVTARLRRSTDVDEFDLYQAEKETAALLDPNAKRLEKKVARERHGWSLSENAVLQAKMRVLRYTREIELNRARRERDLRFLRKKGVDLSFASKLTSEDEIE